MKFFRTCSPHIEKDLMGLHSKFINGGDLGATGTSLFRTDHFPFTKADLVPQFFAGHARGL